MIPYLKALLFDEGAFLGAIRTLLVVVGAGGVTETIPWPAGWEWVGLVLMGAGSFMRSSAKPEPPK